MPPESLEQDNTDNDDFTHDDAEDDGDAKPRKRRYNFTSPGLLKYRMRDKVDLGLPVGAPRRPSTASKGFLSNRKLSKLPSGSP